MCERIRPRVRVNSCKPWEGIRLCVMRKLISAVGRMPRSDKCCGGDRIPRDRFSDLQEESMRGVDPGWLGSDGKEGGRESRRGIRRVGWKNSAREAVKSAGQWTGIQGRSKDKRKVDRWVRKG